MPPTLPAARGETLIHHCHLLDGVADRRRPHAAVLVRDGRIAACGDEDEVRAVAGADAADVDLAGATVTAGLVNMHTHLSLSLPGAAGEEIERLSAHGLALHMAAAARRTLMAGVTTVRCVAEKDHADFALRDAIAAGVVVGPRIYTAGQALCCTGGHGHAGADTVECDGADEFRRATRTQIRAGADLIKVMVSGGIAGYHEQIHTPQLTEAETAAVVDTAHAWGRKVTAHAGPAAVIETAVRLGLDGVEHGYQLTPEVAKLMAERHTALVPTLVVTRCGDYFAELGVPGWMRRRSLDAGPRHADSYRMALDAGVEVHVGSDMPPYWPFEGTSATVRELEHMAALGLDPLEAVRAATAGPARWLGAGDELGTVEVGKHADLVATDGDPSADVSAYRSLRWVMQAGRVVRDDRSVAPAPA